VPLGCRDVTLGVSCGDWGTAPLAAPSAGAGGTSDGLASDGAAGIAQPPDPHALELPPQRPRRQPANDWLSLATSAAKVNSTTDSPNFPLIAFSSLKKHNDTNAPH
jgi:hypothetical protein